MKILLYNMRPFILFILLLSFATGCGEDYLQEENRTSITQDNYFTSAAQAQSAVDGIYAQLRTFLDGYRYGEHPFVAIELLVGHATTLGQSDFNAELIAHTTGTNSPVFENVWVDLYNGVANANLAINRIPEVSMDEARKQALLGEAHFLRAFYYYYLVRLYGDIPLITEPISASSEELYPERDAQEAVYDLIVADLETAEASGLPEVDRTGRVALGAVKSLLASVYLTMAGAPLNRGTEYYQLAADKAEEVIDAGWYPLFEDYLYLHDRAHKNQGELIFQVQYQSGIFTNSLIEQITPEKIGVSPFGGELGSLMPRTEFVESYEDGDLRAQEREFYFTEYPKNGTGPIVEFGQYALYKFWLEEAAGPNGDVEGDENWTLLRMPEVMLIYAEASNEVNGPTQKAVDQLAAIRNRALLSTPLAGEFTQESFRQAVWRERYHELSYENKAYFDIQRTRKAYDLASDSFVDVIGYTNVSGTAFTEKYLLWSIPQSELDTNPKLLPNNPGW